MARTTQTARKSTGGKERHFAIGKTSTGKMTIDLTKYSYRQPTYETFSRRESVRLTPLSHELSAQKAPSVQSTRRVATHVLIERPVTQAEAVSTITPPNSSAYTTRAAATQSSLHLPFARMSLSPASLLSASTPHSWTYHERQALVLFRRLYENDFEDLNKILNHMFPGNHAPFRVRMLQSQHSWLKAGLGPADGKAAYASVWKWNFNELGNHFAYHVARIEMAAESLLIELRERHNDLLSDHKATRTLRGREPGLFKAVRLSEVRSLRGDTPMSLISVEPVTPKHESIQQSVPSQELSIGSAAEAIAPQPAMVEGTPYVTPPSTPPATRLMLMPPPRPPPQMSDFEPNSVPKLLWRCVATYTPGHSGETHIYSGRHTELVGRAIPPCLDAVWLLREAEYHLSRVKMHSPFISTTQSLSWTIMKSYHEMHISRENAQLPTQTSKDMQVYTIDSMQAGKQTNIFKGSLFAQELRARRRFQAQGILSAGDNFVSLEACNYQGHFDFLLYGAISGPAIIKRVTLADLEALAAACRHVARFLRLDLFKDTFKIRKIMAQMSREPLDFDRSVAIAIAKLMRFFGVGTSASTHVITAFICTLFQNWCIEVDSTDDYTDELKVLIYVFAGQNIPQNIQLKLESCLKDAVVFRLQRRRL